MKSHEPKKQEQNKKKKEVMGKERTIKNQIEKGEKTIKR
jgi:hypothetical protein